jgi:hypothetical protein
MMRLDAAASGCLQGQVVRAEVVAGIHRWIAQIPFDRPTQHLVGLAVLPLQHPAGLGPVHEEVWLSAPVSFRSSKVVLDNLDQLQVAASGLNDLLSEEPVRRRRWLNDVEDLAGRGRRAPAPQSPRRPRL